MPRPCSEVLVQQGKLLIKNRGGWLFVLISLLEGLFIFCFVMVRIHFGPGLCSVPLWSHQPSLYGLTLLCLRFSILKMKIGFGWTSQYNGQKTYFL